MPATAPTRATTFETAEDYERWLSAHHATAGEIWLKIAKKNAPIPTLTITEALEVALCYGWIDSHRRALDADHYLQRYSPRTPRSPWSVINRGKAERLTAAGRMREPGFAAIESAKADGRWPG
ncbi:YdeI/OmpD-associated family protein [Nocardia testacea]|uniref:YdeI/OmpD-associated family protein n=1 Tax=Nocardia testacea TaxID=248551 RepID=UPI0033CDF0AE